MDKKIKIAMVTNHFGITGISTVILNYCKELDYHKYDLTVIAGRPIAEESSAIFLSPFVCFYCSHFPDHLQIYILILT